MRILVCAMATVLLFQSGGGAAAASRDVQYGPAAEWVFVPPTPTVTTPPEGAPVQVSYSDTQIRLDFDEQQTYSAQRVKILTPEGLALGNLALAWNPSTEDITIHSLKVSRGNRTIDVLTTTKFQVIQREDRLDYAMLDGQLTATMQIPGLQIGDEFEFAVTIRRRDPLFGDRPSGFAQMPVVTMPGAYRARFTWPAERTLHWQVSPDMKEETPVERDGWNQLTYEIRDPKLAHATDGAPWRFNVRRLIEYSSFTDWSGVSSVLWPLFDKAATLASDSPVRAEAARIAATTADPAARAEAALALVQDRIRYVYVGLDGGNYRPASADETWVRRFGDCKAKTALLLALLGELGITGEAVLIPAIGGDGIDERLPTQVVFDHVLVRATIAGRAYWLDGTHIGERLATLPPPTFRWVLPLRSGDVSLEAVPPEAPALPDVIQVLDVDARAGFDAPAKVAAEHILRGEGVVGLKTRLSAMAPEDAERAQDAFWRQAIAWAEPVTTAWRYDEGQGIVVLSMSGEGRLFWQGDALQGRTLEIFDAGFVAPTPLRRPKSQDQTAPWVTDFPAYKCWVTTMRLPPEAGRWRWSYDAAPIDQRLGGIAYWRRASLQDGVMRTVMSKRTLVPEISPTEAQALNDSLPRFDKYASRVIQVDGGSRQSSTAVSIGRINPGGEQAAIDWTSPAAPCAAPDGRDMASDTAPLPAVQAAEVAETEPAPASQAKSDDDVTTPPEQDPDYPVTQPYYPRQAVMESQEGAVILHFTVRRDGSVDPESIGVDESSGYPLLDVAAISEAATWRFKPARKKASR